MKAASILPGRDGIFRTATTWKITTHSLLSDATLIIRIMSRSLSPASMFSLPYLYNLVAYPPGYARVDE
jgi:hypothetical protein